MFKLSILCSLIISLCILGCSKHESTDTATKHEKDIVDILKKPTFSNDKPLAARLFNGQVVIQKQPYNSILEYEVRIMADHKVSATLQKTSNGICRAYKLEGTIEVADDEQPILHFYKTSSTLSTLFDQFHEKSMEPPKLNIANNNYLHIYLLADSNYTRSQGQPCNLISTSAYIITEDALQNEINNTSTWVDAYSIYKNIKMDLKNSLKAQSYHSSYIVNENLGFTFLNDTFEIVGISIPISSFLVGANGPAPYTAETNTVHTVDLSSHDTALRSGIQETAIEINQVLSISTSPNLKDANDDFVLSRIIGLGGIKGMDDYK